MCLMKTPDVAPPAMAKETARSRMPDGDTIGTDARRRVTDQRRAATSTVLTQNGNNTGTLTTSGKTLLGA